MKRQRIRLVIGLLFLLMLPFQVKSQRVVVGSSGEAEKAALLEIKDRQANNPADITSADNVTSQSGGLGLSRVQLKNLKTLEPFVSVDAAWMANTGKIKEKHAGLMVYNIYVSPSTESDADKRFKQGIYLWDGEQWSMVGDGLGKKFFYMPAFNLPLLKVTESSDTKPTYDLYAYYAQQFTKTGNSTFKSSSGSIDRVPSSPEDGRLYARTELDYAVVYYDDDVVAVTGIDTNGVMTYEVKDTNPEPTSFMNIVFIVKE